MLPLTTVRGDATSPQAKGPKIVAHVCNDLGGWGKGFVVAVSRRWPEPERDYRAWHRGRSGNDFSLGAVHVIQVKPDIWVANMVGQRGCLSLQLPGCATATASRWAIPYAVAHRDCVPLCSGHGS